MVNNISEEHKLSPAEEQLKGLLEFFSSEDADISALSNFPEDIVEGMYSFAYGYYEQGRYEEAELLFRILVSVRMKSSLYWKGLGATLQMRKKYSEAIEAYSWSALQDEKFKDPYPHFHAAECLYTLGEVSRGLQALQSAKAIAAKVGNYSGLLTQIDLLQKTWKKKS